MQGLYDTHAHLNLGAFKNNYKEIAEQCLRQGMLLNNVGTDKQSSKLALDISEEFESGMYAVVGMHPDTVSAETVFDYEYFKKLAESKKVVGIGECGLDYYRLPENIAKEDMFELQAPVFLAQIKLAKELDKALVIHARASKDSVDAYDDTLKLLQQAKEQFGLPRFEVHSFTADLSIAKQFLELGGYIGLNGIITFDKTGVLKEVVNQVPLEKIVLETDAPYLAPEPYRGQTNLPQYVEYVAKYIAEVKGLSPEEVVKTTTANAKTLFNV